MFQKGITNIQILKKAINKQTILKTSSDQQVRGPKVAKTLSKDQEKKIAQSVNEAEKIKSLLAASTASLASKSMFKNMQNRPGQMNLINETKQDFKSSLEQLTLNHKYIGYEDLLDFAILIGLYC